MFSLKLKSRAIVPAHLRDPAPAFAISVAVGPVVGQWFVGVNGSLRACADDCTLLALAVLPVILLVLRREMLKEQTFGNRNRVTSPSARDP